jgi:hypothetical protein
VAEYSRADAANRSGVDLGYIDRLIELGVISPDSTDRLTKGDVRRAQMAQTLENAGMRSRALPPASSTAMVTWHSWTGRPTSDSQHSATRRLRG